MGFSGADANELDHVGVRLEQAAQSLRTKSQRLRASLNAAPWYGRGADRYRHDFNSVHARSLADAARFLDDAYETLARNAQEQRDASGSGHGGLLHRFGITMERIFGRLGGHLRWIEDLPWRVRPSLPWFPVPMPPLFPWIPRFEPPTLPIPWLPFPLPMPRWPDHGWLIPGIDYGAIFGGRDGDGGSHANTSEAPSDEQQLRWGPESPESAPEPTRPQRQPDSEGVHETIGRRIDWREAKSIADREIGALERKSFDFVDGNGTGGDWYQCTSWAKARWREMGYDGPTWYGDGGEVAHKINEMLGRPDEHKPTPGAIVSFTSGTTHVAVVEEIRANSQGVTEFRVSEMNMGGDGWRDATADEFRDDRWVALDSSHVFASFPG